MLVRAAGPLSRGIQSWIINRYLDASTRDHATTDAVPPITHVPPPRALAWHAPPVGAPEVILMGWIACAGLALWSLVDMLSRSKTEWPDSAMSRTSWLFIVL